mmetsp:Transcript_43174/g.101488  ORF Transcript_43174/g.101488 Transcript_43174/m.101488 type:complete len:214 (+) Transcript_43174:78-719(+)
MGNELAKVNGCFDPSSVKTSVSQVVEAIPHNGFCSMESSTHASAVEYDSYLDDIEGPDPPVSGPVTHIAEVCGTTTQACGSTGYKDGSLTVCGVNVADGSTTAPVRKKKRSDRERSMQIGSLEELQASRIDKWAMPGMTEAPNPRQGPRGLRNGNFVADTERGTILRLAEHGSILVEDTDADQSKEAWQKLQDAEAAVRGLDEPAKAEPFGAI